MVNMLRVGLSVSDSWNRFSEVIMMSVSSDTLPGHFPGAINMPFTTFLDDSGKHQKPEILSKLFTEAGVDLQKPLWVSCGSGVTACHVVLAAHLLGHPGACVYDGSWSEWFKKAPAEHIISEGGMRV